jgi:hypothetical protein
MEGTMRGLDLRQLINEAEKRVQRGERKITHQLEIISVLERNGRNVTAAKRQLKFLELTQASDVVDRDRLVTRTGGD